MKILLIVIYMFLATTQCGAPRTGEPLAANDATQEAADGGDGQNETIFWEGVVNEREIVWTSSDATYDFNGEKTSLFNWLLNRSMVARCLVLTGEDNDCG